MEQTNKLQDAKKHGVPIINEKQLQEILNPLIGREGTLTLSGGAHFGCVVVDRTYHKRCGICEESYLIVQTLVKQQLVNVETCLCKLTLNEEQL